MKSFMRALVVVLAGAILAAGPAYAKKDKKRRTANSAGRHCGPGESYGDGGGAQTEPG